MAGTQGLDEQAAFSALADNGQVLSTEKPEIAELNEDSTIIDVINALQS